ncbi:MAG: hypothetical protein HY962_08475 [Ignavibacteriae bacterium]|nr:hypothetical protein [Ignavibacteriota bacterium]
MKRIVYSLLLGACAILATSGLARAQELRGAQLEITVSNLLGRTEVLTLGILEGATTGLDQSLGESELPPPPPQEVFDARVASTPGKSNLGTGSLRDFRPVTAALLYTETYVIAFQGGLGATKVKLEWQNPLPGRVTKITVDGVDLTNKSETEFSFPTGQVTVVLSFDNSPLSFTANPSPLVFDANNRDPLPVKSLEIIPAGDTRAQWQLTSDVDWLEIEPASGEGRQTVSVAIRTGLLPAGAYNGTILVRSFVYPARADVPVRLNFTVGADAPPLPDGMSLSQNFPNPGRGLTAIEAGISSQVPSSETPTFVIRDLAGRDVLDLSARLRREGGAQTVVFDASALPAGTYTYTLRHGAHEISRTMVIVK